MTKKEFDLICMKAKKVDQALGQLISILQAVDIDSLSSSNDNSSDESNDGKEKKSKKFMVADPRIKELMDSAAERKQKELEKTKNENSNKDINSVDRTAPYTVIINEVLDSEKIEVYDAKNNCYGILEAEAELVDDINKSLESNEYPSDGIEIGLTSGELESLQGFWYSKQPNVAETE